MDVTKEDAIGSFASTTSVVEGERNDISHVIWVLKWLDGCIEIRFIRQVNALKDGALGVKQVAVVVTARAPVLGQHAMGTGAGACSVATIQTQLLAATVSILTDVGACEAEQDTKQERDHVRALTGI